MGFIEDAIKIMKEVAPKYNIKCYSAPLAQFVLESANGTSELAVNAHNYAGLKYNENRCPTSNGIYRKVGSEQDALTGQYTSSSMNWFKFPNMKTGIIGYYDFINIANYANLKNISDPETYLKNIKADKYCTSINYVQNCTNVIQKYNLTKYDKEGGNEIMKFTNSPLVNYTKLSPNKSIRTHAIDTITIHCMAGNSTIETCGNIFALTSRRASSNYGIGSDGRIGMYVEEKNRSWCSSNTANDNRAITIEVANDGGTPNWHVSDKAMDSLIKLCADVCKRNGIKELKWKADKSLIGQVDKQNMTVHRWFAAKACPGNYLYNKHPYIVGEVNKILKGNTIAQPSQTPSTSSTPFPTFYMYGSEPKSIITGNPNQFTQIVQNIKTVLNKDYGLKFAVNGIVDDILLINLGNIVMSTSSYNKNLTYCLQQLFVWWNVNLTIDGLFGSATRTNIMNFQRIWNITQTGTTTKEFWYKILGK